jgi:hypothetical protein
MGKKIQQQVSRAGIEEYFIHQLVVDWPHDFEETLTMRHYA